MAEGAVQRVVPMLSYVDVGGAADWITRAFGFEELDRWTDADGSVTHVNMAYGGSLLMLGNPGPAYQGPARHAQVCELARRWSETPFVVDGVYVQVDDVEAHFRSGAGRRRHNPLAPRRQPRRWPASVPGRGSRRPPLDVRPAVLK